VDSLLAEARRIEATTPGLQPLLSAEAAAQRARERKRPPRDPVSPNWGYRFAILLGVLGVLLAGGLVYWLVDTGLRNDAAAKCLRAIEPEVAPMRQAYELGMTAREAREYAKAGEVFKRVADRGGVLLLRLRDEAAPRDADLQRKSADLRRELADLVQRAEKALAAPDVKYGAQGMVEYEGEWVAPEEKEKRFQSRMKAEGKQLHQGEWLTEAEIHERKGEVLYQGRWIPKAERDRLEAASAAVAAAAAAPTTTLPPRRPRPAPVRIVPMQFDPVADSWAIDSFQTPALLWTNETWGNINPVALEVEQYEDAGALSITFKGGKHDKSAIVRPLGLSFATRGKLTMDIVNATTGSVKVAIALKTAKYYESRWVPLKTGVNKGVTFDLRAGDYKSEATHWSPATKIANIENVEMLYILLYTDPNISGKVYLRNIQALRGG